MKGGESVIELEKPAFGIGDENGIGHGGERCFQQGPAPAHRSFTCPHLFLCVLALRNVPGGARDDLNLSVRPQNRREDVLVDAGDSGPGRFERHLALDGAPGPHHFGDFAHVHIVVPLFISQLTAGLSGNFRKLHAQDFQQALIRVQKPSLAVE